MADELKQKGNAAFLANDFVAAEEFYRKAIEDFEPTHILHTNRAAALISLGNFREAISDCDKAISLDPTWTKAYFRKATAQEKVGDLKGTYLTWLLAAEKCETSPWLKSQLQNATNNWMKCFKTVSVSDRKDFLSRYKLVKNVREKLSTMAHFWNASTRDERLKHFHFLIGLIGGEGKSSQYTEHITSQVLPAMPMDNYIDLPREAIEPWVVFYENQSAEEKTAILNGMWDHLTSTEQNTVIQDLRVFISQAMQQAEYAKMAAKEESKEAKVEELDP
mmetsp:Transcript_24553/g.24795  ORF Transcript_24553/g.24795 Transcript_24553/m.24795 type:complete len:277 (+) Transcript_24553:70-900(+)|eukprot:CAMPEP_0182417918 /NCGR_PEP_ID=MMETSP1167-20130531/2373_1 /TAXON_ID=2988 /ORGANISM="Mallomonas Sp, Strain CCMP3275" /LENGTH=276 /DNA_ID=CAMNT_0024591791 /DNA_START=59 /DNA_END=889 /DNA_ORIENTATION=-